MVDGIFSTPTWRPTTRGFARPRLYHGPDARFYRDGDAWRYRGGLDIRDFVTPDMDESYNTNDYAGWRARLVTPIVEERYAPLEETDAVRDRFRRYARYYAPSRSKRFVDSWFERDHDARGPRAVTAHAAGRSNHERPSRGMSRRRHPGGRPALMSSAHCDPALWRATVARARITDAGRSARQPPPLRRGGEGGDQRILERSRPVAGPDCDETEACAFFLSRQKRLWLVFAAPPHSTWASTPTASRKSAMWALAPPRRSTSPIRKTRTPSPRVEAARLPGGLYPDITANVKAIFSEAFEKLSHAIAHNGPGGITPEHGYRFDQVPSAATDASLLSLWSCQTQLHHPQESPMTPYLWRGNRRHQTPGRLGDRDGHTRPERGDVDQAPQAPGWLDAPPGRSSRAARRWPPPPSALIRRPRRLRHRPVLVSHQIEGWEGVHLKTWFEDRFKLPACVENDANAAGWAEYCLGAGRGTRCFVYCNIGSGIGGALVVNGQLYNGQGLGACEIGHTYVPDWTADAPGAADKLEHLCSGWSITRRIQSWSDLDPDSILGRLAGGDARALTCPILAEAARQGDSRALAEIGAVANAVGRALSNVVTLLHPERIALGGGVALMGDILLKPLAIDQHASAPTVAATSSFPALVKTSSPRSCSQAMSDPPTRP